MVAGVARGKCVGEPATQSLIAEAMGQHGPKGYMYGAIGFSVLVEALNIPGRKGKEPVTLHDLRRAEGDERRRQLSVRVSVSA
ncbi:MAG: hypothetical protein AVDCRST_MAG50-602 [uncultured Acidimicrobiales bacterium]|uniref:Uncharacterized protein n=1 Tax=uncultured Acidimicrobiales bacterium TaxID=310071 RepID=A0A6J4HDD5_9ACTN|nr:MAG: hypothetical protein AVDCRST_MAG50-602 [uncultured Acidimicrobiales bacterium]